ncbi:MAG: aldolase, partial [Nitrososphaerota archaeon]
GKYRIVPFTTLQKFLILIRKFDEERIIIKPTIDEALDFLRKENYCNPHYLVNNEYKQSIRNRFFKDLLQKTDFYIINNRKTPEEIQKEIAKILNI